MIRDGRSGFDRLLVLGLCAAALAVMTSSAAATARDDYIRGYVAAVLERDLGVDPTSLGVHDGVVTLSARSLPAGASGRVIAALSKIRGVVRVQVLEEAQPSSPSPLREVKEAPGPTAVAAGEDDRLPTGGLPPGLLFHPLLADPRWPNFSAAYQRFVGDRQFGDIAAVSFGESFPFYRGDVPGGGQWEVGLHAGVFAVFDLDAPSFDLVNADYMAGVPLTYRNGPFSAMGRVFHQSSHLGDEFLLRTRVNRVNLSYESVDAKLSYEVFDRVLRLYGGAGYLFEHDPSSLRPWSTQFGFEARSPWRLFDGGVQPVFAADFQNREENGWRTDVSLRAGLELQGVSVLGRRLLWTFEYFNGHSPNGQFYKQSVDYFGVGAHLYY